MVVKFGVIHDTYGWRLNTLPITKTQIAMLEQPVGKERKAQAVSLPHSIKRAVMEVIGNVYDGVLNDA